MMIPALAHGSRPAVIDGDGWSRSPAGTSPVIEATRTVIVPLEPNGWCTK